MSESMYGGWSIGQINIKYKRGTNVPAQGQCIAIDGGGGGFTSCNKLFRSACERVTATTFAPQWARARDVALPIPEWHNMQKHKVFFQTHANST